MEHATGIDRPDLAAKKDLTALKTKVDKLDINKLTNVLTCSNNLKAKIDDLDVGKLKILPVDFLKKLSDVVDNEVNKNTKFYTLKTKSKWYKKGNSWYNYISSHKLIQHR